MIDYLKKYLKTDLEEGIKKLNEGIPVQYIVGNVDFCGNIIDVNENVLIPRFETEELVDRTIKRLKNKTNPKIVDLGTGSGCIAITLAKSLNTTIDAVDISPKALEDKNYSHFFLKKEYHSTVDLQFCDHFR